MNPADRPARVSHSEPFPGILQVTLEGEIGTGSAATLNELFRRLLVDGSRKLVVDLTKATYLSSSVIGTIVQASDEMKKLGGAFAMAGVPSKILHVFKLLGVVPGVPVYPTVEDALLELAQSA